MGDTFFSVTYLQLHAVLVGIACLLMAVLPQITVAFEQPGTSSSKPYLARCYAFTAVATEPNGKTACRTAGFGDACTELGNRINNVDGLNSCGNTPGYASFGKDLIIYNQRMDVATVFILCVEGLSLLVIVALVTYTHVRQKQMSERVGIPLFRPRSSALIGMTKLLHTIAAIASIVLVDATYKALDELRYDGNSNAGQTVWIGGGLRAMAALPFASLVLDMMVLEFRVAPHVQVATGTRKYLQET